MKLQPKPLYTTNDNYSIEVEKMVRNEISQKVGQRVHVRAQVSVPWNGQRVAWCVQNIVIDNEVNVIIGGDFNCNFLKNSCDEYINKHRTPYNYSNKIKKACFIGWIYDSRKQIADILQKHPLFDIYGIEAGLRGESYYEKMNEYALTLSLNGGGEWCIRDFESMGLGIPIIRSEAKTPLHKGIYPGQNYIAATPPSDLAFLIYPGISLPQIAEYFIDSIEKNINNTSLYFYSNNNSNSFK